MKTLTYKDPGYARFIKNLDRRAVPTDDLYTIVADIIANVTQRGNKALFEYTEKFDGLKLTSRSLYVTGAELEVAETLVDDDTKAAIAAAKPEFCITHSPGSMVVSDIQNASLSIF